MAHMACSVIGTRQSRDCMLLKRALPGERTDTVTSHPSSATCVGVFLHAQTGERN